MAALPRAVLRFGLNTQRGAAITCRRRSWLVRAASGTLAPMTEKPRWHLVADVGGTNARFALTDPSAAAPELVEPLTLPGAEFATLQHAAEHYLARVGA